jgi:hypothetical protein
MRYHILLCITAVLSLFLLNQNISNAQTPVQLDTSLQNRGIASPLPQTSDSTSQTQQDLNGLTNQTNYYPDYKIPQRETTLLLISGMLLIVTGSLILTSRLWAKVLSPIKKKPVIMPNAVLR